MKPHNEIHLNSLTPGELDEAYQLYRESLFEFIDRAFGWNEAFQQQRFRSSYPLDTLRWITDVNSHRIGLVSLLRKGKSLHLSLLLLYEAHRGLGLGSLVMKKLENLARASGHKITLSTFRENKGAFVFYQKLGYQIDKQDEHFYEISRDLTFLQPDNQMHPRRSPDASGHGVGCSKNKDMNMSIAQDTILTTERLKLRPVDLSDVDLVWEVSRFEGFTDGMTWDPPVSRQEIVEVTRRNQAHWEQGEDYVFTINLLKPACPIGRVGLRKEDPPGTWNLGFWVHPDHWGKGYASEAARAMLKFGFNTLHAEHIVTAHATWNKRSQRVIQGLGFTYVGVNPAGFYKNGDPVEEVEYELRCSL